MSDRPQYLDKYYYEWEQIDVVIGGKSALDSKKFVTSVDDREQVDNFLNGYGLDPNDPVGKAEMFGYFQESLQFVKRYFLKEGSPQGLDLTIPPSLYLITDITDLFLMFSNTNTESTKEEKLWAEVILKVMHTVIHIDKDLRGNYFNVVQTQIFDKFYKHLHRDEDDYLYLGKPGTPESVRVLDFETKAKKSRESTIIKLLHKAEHVAEELFDRVGVRFIVEDKVDILPVVKFILENHICIPHNVKPSRSLNTIFDTEKLKKSHYRLMKKAIRENWEEPQFRVELNKTINRCAPQDDNKRNDFTSNQYQSVQFTCRQLIRFRNPFLAEFNKVRKVAKEEESELSKKILNLDISLIARDIRFFYPYEVQIVDQQSHDINTKGEASHEEYKKMQTKTAMQRLFKSLIEYKQIEIN